jgi:DNA-binding IclR family transcriptional regulator
LRELANRPNQSVSDLAARLGLSRSTTHRILQTLAAAGFLVQDGSSGRYELGSELVRLGRAAEARNALYSKADKHLRALTDSTKESTALFVKRDGSALILLGSDGPHAMRFNVNVGDSTSFNAGAGAKALLAFLPDADIEQVLSGELPRYTENTIVDRDTLRHEIELIRARGWSFSDAEVTPDARAVGAPVFDIMGCVAASISVTSPATRMPSDRIEHFASILVETTVQLSRELGWSPREQRAAL